MTKDNITQLAPSLTRVREVHAVWIYLNDRYGDVMDGFPAAEVLDTQLMSLIDHLEEEERNGNSYRISSKKTQSGEEEDREEQ